MKLRRTETGYATENGRWTVEPVLIGDGANNNGGWSRGRKCWRVTDTRGAVRLGLGGSTVILERLYDARDLIEAYEAQERALGL